MASGALCNHQSRHTIWRRIKRRKLTILAGSCAMIVLYILTNRKPEFHSNVPEYCAPIDVVYTWVNGSEPEFVETMQRYDKSISFDPARFDDKNELRYSLRSLEIHAPWIRHVYIVTNGQIPYWLDLSYEKVTIVPHEVLAPHSSVLPTFSSNAIETFIHRIPQLSKRFLYLNDDVFLGAPLYPEDLYTDAEGVHIYQAWMVPDCAEDCPWTYIGDGACDRHCNIKECQFDGGDCRSAATTDSKKSPTDEWLSSYFIQQDVQNAQRVDEATIAMPKDVLNTQSSVNKSGVHTTFMPRLTLRKKFRKSSRVSTKFGNFKELVRQRNISTLTELQSIVESYNRKLRSKASFSENAVPAIKLKNNENLVNKESMVFPPLTSKKFKSTKDIYSQSLIYTNMLLNRIYGFKARNILAHVGFLFDRDIIEDMETKFSEEILKTLSHRFRASDDLQFAFAYYSYIMSEQKAISVEQIFNEFDTDKSGTWSDREIRTFLTRIYPLPLDWSAVHFFEEVVSNCSKDMELKGNNGIEQPVYSTLVYERYDGSNLPTITQELVVNCHLLADALKANFGLRSKHKHYTNPKNRIQNNFVMLVSNVTEVVDSLDKIRRSPRKFNCINDNLDPEHSETNVLIRNLLEDFYLSFFPMRSKFELNAQFRNRFTNWGDYQKWKRRKRAALVIAYCAATLLTLFLLRILCAHKGKLVRRFCVKKL